MFGNVKAVFRREFKAYFDAPVAYVFLVAFLVLLGFLTFSVARFYEFRQADLSMFFFWHPWVYLLLVPAATMGSWADERRSGTAELLLTMPVTVWEVLVAKLLSAWCFLAVALALTFPMPLTVGYLGAPDWGAVACGYLGSLLLALAAAAIGVFASTLSRSSVVGFVISLALLLLLLIVGFDPVVGSLARWGVSAVITDLLASASLLTHFDALRRGVVDFADVGYYLGISAFFLVAAKTVTDGRRGASRGVIGLVATGVIVVAATVILARLPLRFDFTAERLYTLSDGSRAVLAQLEDEVTFKYFVSSGDERMPTGLKSYATRVKDLLEEYERAAHGQLTVETYDPKPDSDAEEWAQRYGIEPQGAGAFGGGFYFGIVAVAGDREETLGVLSPRTESTLEYDLTRLVTRVAWPERPLLGVMSPLGDLAGAAEGWTAFGELKRDYEVKTLASDVTTIDPAVKTLVLVHPRGLGDQTLYAIDQFVLGGGRLIALVDPLCLGELKGGAGQSAGEGSTLGRLFDAWGVRYDAGQVVVDYSAATRIGDGRGGTDENPAFLSLGARNMAKDDLLVSRLTNVMLPFAGSLGFERGERALEFTPIISSTAEASAQTDRMSIFYGRSRAAAADGQARVLAARIAGTFPSAYPEGPTGTNAVAGALHEGKSAVLVVADADFIADQFCVEVLKTPFGAIPRPMNENLTLFVNLIEQFAGREELIGLRCRGEGVRPFTVVNDLEAEATRRWQRKEEEFQAELSRTQQRLAALQAEKQGGERYVLSRAQQDEIARLRKSQAETRRQLKNVRKELTADIDALGLRLKGVNIALLPVIVIGLGILHAWRRRRRSRRRVK